MGNIAVHHEGGKVWIEWSPNQWYVLYQNSNYPRLRRLLERAGYTHQGTIKSGHDVFKPAFPTSMELH